jgi:hypothetical protein
MEYTTTTTTHAKKSVSFQETITIVRFHNLGGEPSWHTLEDRKRFLLQARMEADAWISKGCYDFLLKDTFHDTSDFSAQEKMDAYAQLPGDDYCRGLERHVCREHGMKRDGFKKGAIRAIVNEGRKRKERGMGVDQSWYQLGEISRLLSKHATIFARRVGAADALVVREGEDKSKVLKLQQQENHDAVDKPVEKGLNPATPDEPRRTKIITVGEEDIAQDLSNSPMSVTTVNAWSQGHRDSLRKNKNTPSVPILA